MIDGGPERTANVTADFRPSVSRRGTLPDIAELMSRRDQLRLGLVLDLNQPGQGRPDQRHRGRHDAGIERDTDDQVARDPDGMTSHRERDVATDGQKNLDENDRAEQRGYEPERKVDRSIRSDPDVLGDPVFGICCSLCTAARRA